MVRPRLGRGVFGSMRVRILAAVVVLLAGSSAVSIVLLRGALLERLDEEITVSLQRETEEFQLLAAGLDPRTGRPFGPDLRSAFDVYFAREVPDQGETMMAFLGSDLYLTESAPDAVPADRLRDAIPYLLSLQQPELASRTIDAGEVRYSVIPLTGAQQSGTFAIVQFPAARSGEIDAAVATQVLIQLGAVVLASLIGLGLASRVLRPLGSLADTAQTISGSDLTRRIPVHGRDEASRIATAFNDMLGRLERAFAAQRQFLDDASHELRAPLTVIRGHVELLELLPEVEEREATTALVLDEIDRMSRIVGDLLLLARVERPDFLSVDTVDIAELTTDIHRKAAVLCPRDWRLEATGRGTIVADGQRLTQAMMQLAQNACQHTDGGGVRIGSAVERGYARLWVHDSGPGVPPGDAERIFQRFVKGSDSPSGSGLGLSIVAAIAEAHGGTARVVTCDRGARFEIVVPVRPVASRPDRSVVLSRSGGARHTPLEG